MAIWSSQSSKNYTKKNIGQTKAMVKQAISPYHCVELKIPYDSCEEVLKLQGVRFLSAEAPTLPLPGCDKYCTCKYKHHNDRRCKDDRRDAFSASAIHFGGNKNRRLGGERRRSYQRHISLG